MRCRWRKAIRHSYNIEGASCRQSRRLDSGDAGDLQQDTCVIRASILYLTRRPNRCARVCKVDGGGRVYLCDGVECESRNIPGKVGRGRWLFDIDELDGDQAAHNIDCDAAKGDYFECGDNEMIEHAVRDLKGDRDFSSADGSK